MKCAARVRRKDGLQAVVLIILCVSGVLESVPLEHETNKPVKVFGVYVDVVKELVQVEVALVVECILLNGEDTFFPGEEVGAGRYL